MRNSRSACLQSRKWGVLQAGRTALPRDPGARGARSRPALQGPLWSRRGAPLEAQSRTGWAQSRGALSGEGSLHRPHSIPRAGRAGVPGPRRPTLGRAPRGHGQHLWTPNLRPGPLRPGSVTCCGCWRSEARGNRDRCQEPQRASRGGCAPAERAPESGDTGPRVSPGMEAGGAPAGGPGLQGRWRFPPAPWAGPGRTSGHSAPQPQGRRGL